VIFIVGEHLYIRRQSYDDIRLANVQVALTQTGETGANLSSEMAPSPKQGQLLNPVLPTLAPADERSHPETQGPASLFEPAAIPSTLLARPARLGQLVVLSLIDQVVSGRLPAGSPLPPEPALCQEFNVSRSVIRESVRTLEEKGLVVARQGQGTTVLPPEEWDLVDPLVLEAFIRNDRSLTIFDDLIEVRAALEAQMARRAATKMSKAQLEELHRQLQSLKALLDDPDGYAQADVLYHDTIGRFSGHVLASSILRTVQPIALANAYYGATHKSRQDNLRSHQGHVAIYERLSKRDADGAAREVEAHIMGSWATYKRSRSRPSKNV
jgi:DNA-binding FadR family transcriptional regulator